MADCKAALSAVAVAMLLVLAGCGGSTTATHHTSSPTPRASPTSASPAVVFPSPTPGGPTAVPPATVSCSSAIPAGAQLALVTLSVGAGIVVRDITDITHPVSRCKVSGGSYFRFYDETHISYIALPPAAGLGAPGSLYLVDLQSQVTSLVRSWGYGGFASWVYNWSPDGRELTYLTSDATSVQWHVLSAAGDRTLSTLGPVPGRDVNPDGDDAMVGFSADGQYVAMVQTFTTGSAPRFQINRISDGRVAYSRTNGTMAAWAGSGARLYFRTSAGVQSWSPTGIVTTVTAGAMWIHPQASADGTRMAYSLLNAQGNHIGQVLDLATGAIQKLSAQPRVGAAFLNTSLVWYAGETICTTITPCGLGGPPLSGQTYIYDLASNVENGSVDTALFDSWPHVVGQT